MPVAISIPKNTVVPIEWRLTAPAPPATSSGETPKMKASDVIRIGRSRSRAASDAALSSGTPCSCSELANSTIRIAFLAERPTTVMSPTCT